MKLIPGPEDECRIAYILKRERYKLFEARMALKRSCLGMLKQKAGSIAVSGVRNA